MLRAALLGSGIQRSLSPALHRAAAASVGLQAEYTLVDVPSDAVDQAVDDLLNRGLNGWNITAPHKEFIAKRVTQLTERAARLGAVNTVVMGTDSTSLGDNTDVLGFESLLGDWPGGRAVILGAGGAARAVADVLNTAGATIEILNRNESRARALKSQLAPQAQVFSLNKLEERMRGAGLLVNTTGASLRPRLNRLPFSVMGPSATFLDLSYGPDVVPTLSLASAAGCESRGGLDMLIGQGLASFSLWTGLQADPLHVRKALTGMTDL